MFLLFASVRVRVPRACSLVGQMEPACKWARVTLAHTLLRLRDALHSSAEETTEGTEGGELLAEVGAAVAELAAIDPCRGGYYAHLTATTAPV